MSRTSFLHLKNYILFSDKPHCSRSSSTFFPLCRGVYLPHPFRNLSDCLSPGAVQLHYSKLENRPPLRAPPLSDLACALPVNRNAIVITPNGFRTRMSFTPSPIFAAPSAISIFAPDSVRCVYWSCHAAISSKS